MTRKLNMTKIIFTLYLGILIWVVLFKAGVSLNDINLLKGERVINFIPFYWGCNIGRLQIKEAIMNILIFLPAGIYSRMLGTNTIKTIAFGFSLSFLFEICQYILAIGVCDITDIINNTVGVAIGVLLYALLEKIFSKSIPLSRVINTLSMAFLAIIFALTLILFITNI